MLIWGGGRTSGRYREISIVSGQAVILEGRCSSTDVRLPDSLILAFVQSNDLLGEVWLVAGKLSN